MEQSGARRHFRHRRLGDIGDGTGYLPVGLFGSRYHWIAKVGQPHSFSAKATNLRLMLERCPRLKLLIDY